MANYRSIGNNKEDYVNSYAIQKHYFKEIGLGFYYKRRKLINKEPLKYL